MMVILSYLAVFIILLTYFSGSQRAFNWANVFCNVPLLIVAYNGRVYGSAAISLSFLLIGGFHIWKDIGTN